MFARFLAWYTKQHILVQVALLSIGLFLAGALGIVGILYLYFFIYHLGAVAAICIVGLFITTIIAAMLIDEWRDRQKSAGRREKYSIEWRESKNEYSRSINKNVRNKKI